MIEGKKESHSTDGSRFLIEYNAANLEIMLKNGVVGEQRTNLEWFERISVGDLFIVFDSTKKELVGTFRVESPVQENMFGDLYWGHRPFQAACRLVSTQVFRKDLNLFIPILQDVNPNLRSTLLPMEIFERIASVLELTDNKAPNYELPPRFVGDYYLDGLIWGAGVPVGKKGVVIRVNEIPGQVLDEIIERINRHGFETEIFESPNAVTREVDLKLLIKELELRPSELPSMKERRIDQNSPDEFLESYILSKLRIVPWNRRHSDDAPFEYIMRLKLSPWKNYDAIVSFFERRGIVYSLMRKMIEVSPISYNREPLKRYLGGIKAESVEFLGQISDVDTELQNIQSEVTGKESKLEFDDQSLYYVDAVKSQTGDAQVGDGRRILIFTATNNPAWSNWSKTILNPVRIETIYEFLTADDLIRLQNIENETGELHIWGLPDNDIFNSLFGKIAEGDAAIGYRCGVYKFLFKVSYLTKNGKLARHLWGRQDDGVLCRNLVFLSHKLEIEQSRLHINRILGKDDDWFPSYYCRLGLADSNVTDPFEKIASELIGARSKSDGA